MRHPRAGSSLALALVCAACAVPPQPTPTVAAVAALQALADSARELPRPRLLRGTDTNSAAAYYQQAAELVRFSLKLDTADLSLYWASRLDPTWADPLFLRGLVVLRALRKDALDALRRTRSLRAARDLGLPPRQFQRVDSLFHIAWGRNPFLFTDLDPPPFWGGPRDPSGAASFAFTMRRFSQAESLFALVLRKHPDNAFLRIYRARALFYLGRFDAAVVELEAARDTVRRSAEARLSAVLPSVEMFEFAIGIARVQQDDFPAARAAFERALTENLGFYWAHARLAGAALALHDTAMALSELDLAIQLEGRDPVLRLYDGAVLQGAGRLAQADEQFRRAIELDPYYAAPYFWRAVNGHLRGDTSAAIDQYRQFLGHAARDDAYRARAVQALAALSAVPPDSR